MTKPKHATASAPADALSSEVSLRAQIDNSGLTVAGRSRALSAVDRLLGGAIGIPAEFFEGIRRRMELRGKQKEEYIIQQGVNFCKDNKVTPALVSPTRRLIADETRKQLNREAIVLEAMSTINELPEQEPDTLSPDEPSVLDEDWINVFSAFAEKASSERLQQLWGRILSGEIRKPGSFGLNTLRVISELDAEIATIFQDVCRYRLLNGMVPKPNPFIESSLLNWTMLEEVGLLQDVSGSLAIEGGEGVAAQTETYCLIIRAKPGGANLRLPVVKITRAGQQIASILPWDEREALYKAGSVIAKSFEVFIAEVGERGTTALKHGPLEAMTY